MTAPDQVPGVLDTEGLFKHNPGLMRVLPSDRLVDPLNLQPDDIDINDIARSLSRQCRYNGHVGGFLSVARHAVWVAELVMDETGDPQLALEALHHDDAEAYLSDMIRPLKHGPLGGIFREAEERAEQVIFAKFGLTYPLRDEIKAIDSLAGHLEINFRRDSWDSQPWVDERLYLLSHEALTAMREDGL